MSSRTVNLLLFINQLISFHFLLQCYLRSSLLLGSLWRLPRSLPSGTRYPPPPRVGGETVLRPLLPYTLCVNTPSPLPPPPPRLLPDGVRNRSTLHLGGGTTPTSYRYLLSRDPLAEVKLNRHCSLPFSRGSLTSVLTSRSCPPATSTLPVVPAVPP